MKTNAPLKVLILSTDNSVRSILGEYLLRAKAMGRFEVYSAGLESNVGVHPLTVWVLENRYGIDARNARGKSLDELQGIAFDCVITVCDKAVETPLVWPGKPILAHWGSRNPLAVVDSERRTKRAFVEVASQISRRSELLCALPLQLFDEYRVQEIGREAMLERELETVR